MEPSDCGHKRFYPLNALGIELGSFVLANKNALNCCKTNHLHLKKTRTIQVPEDAQEFERWM